MAETGVERIAAAFAAARGDGRAALMPYLMGGFPDLATSRAVIDAYADTGADLIELGVPYSDPLADGPRDPRGRDRGARGRRDASSGVHGALRARRRRASRCCRWSTRTSC